MENTEFLNEKYQRNKALKALEIAKALETVKKSQGYKWVSDSKFNTKILRR